MTTKPIIFANIEYLDQSFNVFDHDIHSLREADLTSLADRLSASGSHTLAAKTRAKALYTRATLDYLDMMAQEPAIGAMLAADDAAHRVADRARPLDLDAATWTYKPAEDDQTDPEHVLDQDPCWTIQVCTAYGGGYGVNQHAPEGTPDAEFWMRDFGAYRTLAAAKVKLIAARNAELAKGE